MPVSPACGDEKDRVTFGLRAPPITNQNARETAHDTVRPLDCHPPRRNTVSFLIRECPTYPDKPIRLIVSIAAGSVTDVIMRAAAKDLEPKFGQPLVIENRGGAAGILGGQACAQSPGDGYTLCVIYHDQCRIIRCSSTTCPTTPIRISCRSRGCSF